MDRAWRRPVALFAALAAALAVVACGAPAPPAPLRVLHTDDVLALDPNRNNEHVTMSVLVNVFEGLVGLDGELGLKPVLAESWEHLTAERWRFRLRPGVRFHDGTPLTAEAVRDSLFAIRADAGSDVAGFLGDVAEVVVVDERTLEIVTREPRAILSSLPFVFVTRSSQGGFPPLVGTGPYRIAEWEQGRRLRLTAWEGHWAGPPPIREVTVVPASDARERVRALQEKRADLVYGVPPDLARTAAPGTRVARRQGLTVFYLGYRFDRGNPFGDLRVRQAADLALDRQAIVDGALAGMGTVATQPVAPLVFGFNPDLPPRHHDPGRAAALLREAGLGDGFEVRLDFGEAFRSTANLIRDQLARVGIRVELNGFDRKAALREAGLSGRTGFFLARWDCSTGEAAEFFEFCLHTPTRGLGQVNYGAYSNPRIDELVRTQSALLDPRRRQAALQDGMAVVMEDLAVLPLYVEDDLYGVREGIQFTPRAIRQVLFRDVRSAAGR